MARVTSKKLTVKKRTTVETTVIINSPEDFRELLKAADIGFPDGAQLEVMLTVDNGYGQEVSEQLSSANSYITFTWRTVKDG